MPRVESCVVGLDLGGTDLKYGLITEKGFILYQNSVPANTSGGGKQVLETMASAARDALKMAKKQGLDVSAIGAGCPGNIDSQRGLSLAPTPHIIAWENAPIGPHLAEKTGLPVYVDNDANVMTLAESVVGAGKDYDHVVGITLGTGVGGGIVVKGEIFHGSAFNAAELGHVSIDAQGRPCSCGNRGCVERYAGAKYLVQDVQTALKSGEESIITQGLRTPDDIDAKLIFSAAAHGDELCGRIVTQMIEALAAALSSVVNVLNPQVIVIGGGISEAGERLIHRIDAAVKSRVMKPDRTRLQIVKAQLGNNAGMIGAALNATRQRTGYSGKS